MLIKIRYVFFMLIFFGLLAACRTPRLSLPSNVTATSFPSTPSISASSLAPTVTPTASVTIEATTQSTEIITPPTFPSTTPAPFSKSVFDNFQNLSGYCKAKMSFGETLTGQTIEEPVVIDDTIGHLWFSLSWQGDDDLDLTLLYPNGTTVDPTFPDGHEINENFTSKPGLREYFFRGPDSGKWVAKISNKSANGKGVNYQFEASLDSALLPSIDFDKTEYTSGETMKLSISLEDDYLAPGPSSPALVRDAVIKIIVEDPAHNQSSFELYDNGTHGDPSAGDGTYTNSFNKTSSPGIYKFDFQISGHNVRSKQPFTRECFLAQTVKAIEATATPIIGSGNKVCKGKTSVSEPIVVRAEDVGGDDSSEYSRYAMSPRGASTDAGILTNWSLGSNGSAPQPNAYMRLLDDNAHPIGDVALLFQRNWSGRDAYIISRGNDMLITYWGSFGKKDSRLVSALLDAKGQFISEQPRLPEDSFAREKMQGVWTGKNFIFASTGYHYVALNVINELLLEIADANGKSISSKILMKLETPLGAGGSMSINNLVVGHERMLMTISEDINGQRHIYIYPFDLEGNQIGEPVAVDPPSTYEQGGKILTGSYGHTYTLPTENGWMILIQSVEQGFYVAHLDPAGSLISKPKLINNTLMLGDGFVDAISYRNGVAIFSKSPGTSWTVSFVSPYGSIGQEWSIPAGNAQEGALISHKGRLFLLYTSGPKTINPQTNQVLIRELQCAP